MKYEKSAILPSEDQQKKPSSNYRDSIFCRSHLIEIFNESDRLFKLYTKNDPDVKRKDTAKGLVKKDIKFNKRSIRPNEFGNIR